MGSTSVFKSLRELFPQVDLRILRALSIEHEDNVNEAIEFILSEVLPIESTTYKVSSISHESSDREQVSLEDVKGGQYITVPDDIPDSPVGVLNYVGEAENRDSHSLVEGSSAVPVLQPPQLIVDASPKSGQSLISSDSTEDVVLWLPQLAAVDENAKSEQRLDEYYNNSSSSISMSEKVDESLFCNADQEHLTFELLSNGRRDNIVLTEYHTKYAVDEEEFHVGDTKNISGSENEEINIQLNTCDVSGCSSDACRPLNLIDMETVVDAPPAFTSVLSMSTVCGSNQIYQNPTPEEYKVIIDNEKQNLVGLDESSLELPSNKYDECSILLKNLATRSGHMVCTDLLEDSISDAKSSKKILGSTLESMVSMMQEVELLEMKANQVKEDNLLVNRHFLFKVEELQKIVKQSNDEKDMHAGEVYGERSILAAEARELQSRLLKMSEERNEYLSVTEAIFGALEARKAAAQDAITAADIERRDMEELVQKTLNDHELMLSSILAESQKLQQEAEENCKLREFLMDRGRVVDSLQGEIAIVFEDIISLKKKVDSHTTKSKYLQSGSFTYGSLRTDQRPSNSPDHIRSPPSSSSNSVTNKGNPEEHEQLKNSIVCRNNSLDDWELCEN